jgi:hypothetical protein
MDIGKTVVFGALVPLMLACGYSALAQTQGSQTQTTQPQAAPSQAPASQATQAVTGPKGFSPRTEVGTQQAAPSQRPAPQATASAMAKQKTGAQ